LPSEAVHARHGKVVRNNGILLLLSVNIIYSSTLVALLRGVAAVSISMQEMLTPTIGRIRPVF